MHTSDSSNFTLRVPVHLGNVGAAIDVPAEGLGARSQVFTHFPWRRRVSMWYQVGRRHNHIVTIRSLGAGEPA